MYKVRRYQLPDGSVPISEWLSQLQDKRAKAQWAIRFRRMSNGLIGDVKPVGAGVMKLREHVGPGYRVYSGRHGAVTIILLCAGDKSTQKDDVERAKEFWRDWKRRNI